MMMRAIPAWQLKLMRRFPRIAFVTPVDIACGDDHFQGKSLNLSAGGMLVETECQVLPRTQLYVSFQLPTGSPVKSVARVVHCRPGRYLGVEFTRMGNADWNALGKSIEIKESYQRRSIRIPERLMVELYWNHQSLAVHQMAQTILLSRHGCLLLCQSSPPAESRLVIWCPERRIGASARVVSCEQNLEGLAIVALEFARDANFWGIDFEPQDWTRRRPASNDGLQNYFVAQN